MENLGLETLGGLFLYFSSAFGAFLVALWLSLVFWTWRDIRARTYDRFLRILAPLLVLLLTLPGVILYLVLRPRRTLEEEYERALEEEALLAAIEEPLTCPGCSRRADKDWQICPHCHTRLRKSCVRCGRMLELAWNLCPYCGTPAQPMSDETPPVETALGSSPAP
ncbi:MAG TPA: zinc ribbon domain-containing protein [Anaerolineales bacterium]|nr:zinc ribbon domain-containing protein [Anaerolineales bacterium]